MSLPSHLPGITVSFQHVALFSVCLRLPHADIFCVHPHGILSFSAWLAFATEALGFAKLFPGIEMRVLTLVSFYLCCARECSMFGAGCLLSIFLAALTCMLQSINFKAPIFREYLLLHGEF